MSNRNNTKKKWLLAILILNAVIAITAVTLVSAQFDYMYDLGSKYHMEKITSWLLIISSILGIATLIVAIEIIKLLEIETEAKLKSQHIKTLESYNLKLREQRHDFLNHLQVVSGFLQLSKYKQAQHYLLKVSDQMTTTDDENLALDSEVGMLIYSKQLAAKEFNIQWHQEIDANLKYLVMDKVDQVRVMGNIIDNALFELKKVPLNQRKLILSGTIEGDTGVLSVVNYGVAISPHIIEKMFEPGFTTKGNLGEGMGLYIVKTLVEKWGGTIEVSSCTKELWTKISLRIPVRKQDPTDLLTSC